jgi:hypothetical protein
MYEGLYPAQAREQFEAVAREALLHGWRPRYQHWSGTVLRVTYVRQVRPVTRARVGRRSRLRLFR